LQRRHQGGGFDSSSAAQKRRLESGAAKFRTLPLPFKELPADTESARTDCRHFLRRNPMPAAVKPIPDGYSAVTPYLVVQEPAKLIEFLTQAFNAKLHHKSLGPDGNIAHAEVKIDGAPIMIGGARPGVVPTTAMIYLYVTDTDASYKRALAAGGTSVMEPANQFYGDRNAGVKDSAGNQWWIGTHIEDVSPEELDRRMKAMFQKHA
jgi:PhnB protein